MPTAQQRAAQEQRNERDRARRAAKKAAHVAALEAGLQCVPQPPGRHPRDHVWDPSPPGCWRHFETGEVFQPAADRHTTTADRHATRRRNTLRFDGRCHDQIMKPGFDHRKVAPHDAGKLGDCTCKHCGALLFKAEAERSGDGWRGKHCCSDGQVVLPKLKVDPTIDGLWKSDEADGKLLRKYSRQFNNALALASEMYDEVEQDGWAPSIVLQGKLYQQVGPLQPREGEAPKFAQLYVHDPNAEDDEAVRRRGHMYMPATLDTLDMEVPEVTIVALSNLNLPATKQNPAKQGIHALMLEGYTYPLYKTMRELGFDFVKGVHGKDGVNRWVREFSDQFLDQKAEMEKDVTAAFEREGWVVDTAEGDAADWDDDDEDEEDAE